MDTKRPPLYRPAGFYLLRAPILPAATFIHLTDTTCQSVNNTEAELERSLLESRRQSYAVLEQLIDDPVIEQALLVASADMLQGLQALRQPGKQQRRVERTYASVLRYLVRMSTRPTPFGLFSGIAIGTFGAVTTAQMGSPSVRNRRTRPDMSWLLALVQQLEEDDDLLPQLTVIVNSTIYCAGTRAVLPTTDVYGTRDARSVTLRRTSVVDFVLREAQKALPYSTLRQAVGQAFPQASLQQVDTLLQHLWKHHFLISDLRPPLTRANPERYLLDQLRKLPQTVALRSSLEAIIHTACEVDQAHTLQVTPLLQTLKEQQERLVTIPKGQPYQLDTVLNVKTPQINQQIGEAVAEVIEVLLRLSRFPQGTQALREYCAAFISRYGSDAEVPLLDLLNPETGLDAPPGYIRPPRTYPLPGTPSPASSERESTLCRLLAEALYEQRQEIELTDTLLEQLSYWTPDSMPTRPPSALELYLSLQADSREALDQGKWRGIITPACLAYGGRSFGRFFDVLSPEELQLLQEYAQEEETRIPEAIFAELSYLPPFGRSANVAIRPMLRSYEIVINTTPSVEPERVLPLHDLTVAVKAERFVIRSLRLGKEVVVTQSHMLNLASAPNICRFLLEASHDGSPVPGPFDWGAAKTAPFLPRIVRKQMVLSPAQWNLRPSDIQPAGEGNAATRFFRGLQQWRKKWHTPRYVYLTAFDNRLLLDLEHPLLVAELQRELKKTGEQDFLPLQEMLPDFTQLWLSDEQHAPYLAELVVPVLSREREAPSQTQISVRTPRRAIAERERLFLPGSTWLFLKLYASFGQHDELITKTLPTFIHNISKQQLLKSWFFIRYVDPEPHLRLRLCATNEQAEEALLSSALAWGRDLHQKGMIHHLAVDTYAREIERYGGPEAIDILEQVFAANSAALIELIAGMFSAEITLEPLAVAVFSLDHFFEQWGLSFPERLHYVQTYLHSYEASSAFHQQQRYFCTLLKPEDGPSNSALLAQREKLLAISSLQASTLQQASSHVKELDRREALWVPEQQILGSLAHMHINRLLGINREQEHNVYAFWRHSLEALHKRDCALNSYQHFVQN